MQYGSGGKGGFGTWSPADALHEIVEENRRLREENKRLHDECQVDANVRHFMQTMGQSTLEKPGVPSDEIVRLRLKLVGEEFFELMEATFGPGFCGEDEAMHAIETWPVKVDLPAFADACADIDYVVAGARVAFGIDGRPIAAAVHAANMAKIGGPVREDGKRQKPDGWQPPDIAGELRKQGWNG